MRGAFLKDSTTTLAALERLLETLLAATADGHLAELGEGRAEQLAHLLSKMVKEATRLGNTSDE